MSDLAPPPFDILRLNCPSRATFEHVFSRWGFLALVRLTTEPMRFGELARSIEGISERMLAQTLKALEEEGLVERREWAEKPPRVEYRLTESGAVLSASVGRLVVDFYQILEKR
jgi:DNA-binding HxlR family transcriptional regulator